MGRVAEQKRPPAAKMFSHAVVHAVSGKPVDVLDVHFQVFDGAAADIRKLQSFGALRTFVAHRADQSRAAFAGQWKHCEKVRFVQIQMQLTIHRRAAGLDIRHIENLLISATGETGVEVFAHHRPRPVCTCQIAGLADFLLAIGQT
ncbi:hypothetical protein PS718_05587 [Pseudomonas fluorescens]|uniref:Uncharacterized protein n=1 Tax=Pseudomonas fluorescens TaxID=294 RepID=A0A5E7FGM0_PSEFL|nr:hypothetical protein PS718_05587 [Pseudomonas fluorescens]